MTAYLASLGQFAHDHGSLIVVATFVALALVELGGKGHGHAADVGAARMVTNFGLQLSTGIIAVLVPIGNLTAAVAAQDMQAGLFNRVEAPAWFVLVFAIAGRTFALYWLHRAYHATPLLWRIHKIHHSDTSFDLTTGLRSHPIDVVPKVIVFAGMTFVLGLPPWCAILVDMVMLMANFWEHLDRVLPRPAARVLGFVLIVPEAHRVHHSAHQPQTDSNFGGLLTVWDRLFGTWRDPAANPVERIGLGPDGDTDAQNIWRQFAAPFTSTRDAPEHLQRD